LADGEGHIASVIVAGKQEVLSAYFIRYFILAWFNQPHHTSSLGTNGIGNSG